MEDVKLAHCIQTRRDIKFSTRTVHIVCLSKKEMKSHRLQERDEYYPREQSEVQIV